MPDCIFCLIVQGTRPVSLIHRDDLAWVFLSTLPANPGLPGHTLVIPNRHAQLLRDLDETTGMHVFRITLRTQEALRQSSCRCDDITLVVCDGATALQRIPHVHMHVIPRFPGDGFKLNATGGVTTRDAPVPRDELERVAEDIRQTCDRLWGQPQ